MHQIKGLIICCDNSPKKWIHYRFGPNYNYTPARDFHGVDTFEVQASDGSLLSEVAEITLFVESQNDAPYFEYNLATLSGGIRETPLRVKLEVKDVDNENVAISLSSSQETELVILKMKNLYTYQRLDLVESIISAYN